MIAALSVLLGAIEFALLPFRSPVGPLLVPLPLVFWIYVGSGLIAWRRRPRNGTGPLIVAAGIAFYLSGVANTGVPALVAIGAVSSTLVLAVIVHLLLAFPSGRLRGTPSRATVIAIYAVALVLGAPSYLLDPNGPYPPFAVADAPKVVAVFGVAQSVCGAALMLVAAGILVGRLRAADSRHRRVLVPLYSYGIFVVLFMPAFAFVMDRALEWDPTIRGALQFLVIAGVPVAFTLGTLRGGFAQTSELEELGAWLGDTGTENEALERVLARAVGDPSLRLTFSVGGSNAFVDAHGDAMSRSADPRRGWETIALEGRTVGAIEYDARLLADPGLVRTAGRVVAIAVERERLTAELLASQRAVMESRERLVGAADRERRRIARDLHDGIQARLVLLALEVQQLATAPADAVADRATRLRIEIDSAAAELRALVHQLVPAALIERGLAAAVEDLADRMPIPTRFVADLSARFGETTENTAYFVVAEGLTNVLKHSGAAHVSVRLEHAGEGVRVVISDDGRGGAEMDAGTGLRGLVDRVDAIGGTMQIHSEIGEGTTIWAELPFASSSVKTRP